MKERARGSATPTTKLIINPKALGNAVFVCFGDADVGLGSVSIEIA